jgi:hypothetical protein
MLPRMGDCFLAHTSDATFAVVHTQGAAYDLGEISNKLKGRRFELR